MDLIKGMNFTVSHILREGNVCADGLANLGLDISGFVWWQDAPSCIRQATISNMLDLSNFRFITF